MNLALLTTLLFSSCVILAMAENIPPPFTWSGHDPISNKKYLGNFDKSKNYSMFDQVANFQSFLFCSEVTWPHAVDMCHAIGGQLLTIHSADEMRYIKTISEQVWLGYSVDKGTWLDGSSVPEPESVGYGWFENRLPRNGECVAYGSTMWGGMPCDNLYFTICEVTVATQKRRALIDQINSANDVEIESIRGNNTNFRVYVDKRFESLENKLDKLIDLMSNKKPKGQDEV